MRRLCPTKRWTKGCHKCKDRKIVGWLGHDFESRTPTCYQMVRRCFCWVSVSGRGSGTLKPWNLETWSVKPWHHGTQNLEAKTLRTGTLEPTLGGSETTEQKVDQIFILTNNIKQHPKSIQACEDFLKWLSILIEQWLIHAMHLKRNVGCWHAPQAASNQTICVGFVIQEQ